MSIVNDLRNLLPAYANMPIATIAISQAADEIERLNAGWHAANVELLERSQEIERMTKERDALRLDAERWRWWREQVKSPGTRTAAQAMLWNCSFSRSKFDALTDAAMKEKP